MNELEQKLYERGVHADSLLRQELFMQTIHEMSAGLLEAIADTDPKDSKTRETYYYMHRGLKDVMGTIVKLSQHREQLDHEIVEDEAELLSDDDMLDL